MQFSFHTGDIFKDQITVWNTEILLPLEKNTEWWTKFTQAIDTLGFYSGKAQNLAGPITSVYKMMHTDQRIYVFSSPDSVDGILKVGKKKLFVSTDFGMLKEIAPLCVLDFYVVESKQRSGIGKQLFEYMLQNERITPEKIAYDRPSEKLLGFLGKHYGLHSYTPQANNFVVFKRYFSTTTEEGKFALAPVSRRPLTAQRRSSGVARGSKIGTQSDVALTVNPQLQKAVEPSIATDSPTKLPPVEEAVSPPKAEQSPDNSPSYKVVTLPRASYKNNSNQFTQPTHENIFPNPSNNILQSNLTPIHYKKSDIPEPPHRITPSKPGSVSGPAITATQRYRYSPQKGRANTVLGESESDVLQKPVVSTSTPSKREVKLIEEPANSPTRSSEYYQQFYGRRNIY